METYTFLNSGESGENIWYWHSVQNYVDPEYYERKRELGVGPGRPRTLNSKEEFFSVMCWLRQGFAERHLRHLYNVSQSTVSWIVISWVNFMYLWFGQLNIWPCRKVMDDTMPQDFQSKYPNTRAIIDCTEFKCQSSFCYWTLSCFVHTKITQSWNAWLQFPLLDISLLLVRKITERSGFLNLPFDTNDSVMADKGFTIQDLVPVGVSLNIL